MTPYTAPGRRSRASTDDTPCAARTDGSRQVRWRRRALVSVCVVALAAGTTACSAQSSKASAGNAGSSGTLTICSDISFPPLEFYDKSSKPAGSDIELGDAMVKSMGKTVQWRNVAFSGIIPALQAKQCDAIISGLFDKPERRKVVDMIDYIKLGNSLVVPVGKAAGINGFADLAGKKVGAEAGTTLSQELAAANKKLTAEGKPAMQISIFPKDSDAFQQLVVGHLDAYYTSTATEAYYSKTDPGKVQTAGPQLSIFADGIATRKSDTQLRDAFSAALKKIQADGTYKAILARWNLENGAIGNS
jgi:polar amino acid transport system substrate-binding protein